MARREVVDAQRLTEILNEGLSKDGQCADCWFSDRIFELQEPDKTGCNWSDDLIIRCSGRSLSYRCARTVVAVVRSARERYNLIPSG